MKKILIISASVIIIAITVWLGFFRHGTLEVSSDASSIDISINKREYKAIKMPAKFKLRAGKYTIKAGIGNYEEFKDTISIKVGETTSITIIVESEEDIKATEDFYQKNPLIKLLPASEDFFKIDFYQEGTADVKYTITLYPASPSNQRENYINELKQHKKGALDWIKARGVDPATLEIKWEPLEAKDL